MGGAGHHAPARPAHPGAPPAARAARARPAWRSRCGAAGTSGSANWRCRSRARRGPPARNPGRRSAPTNSTRHSTAEGVRDILPDGADHAFECVGRTELIRQAIDLLDRHGQAVLLGVPAADAEASFLVSSMYLDKSVLGCRYGSSRPQRDIALYADLYRAGRLMLDELVTETYPVEDFAKAADDAHHGPGSPGLLRLRDAFRRHSGGVPGPGERPAAPERTRSPARRPAAGAAGRDLRKGCRRWTGTYAGRRSAARPGPPGGAGAARSACRTPRPGPPGRSTGPSTPAGAWPARPSAG